VGLTKERVLDAESVEHLLADLLHLSRARISVLVNAVPEAHKTERRVLVLRVWANANTIHQICY
jgi:hypothetical protein